MNNDEIGMTFSSSTNPSQYKKVLHPLPNVRYINRNIIFEIWMFCILDKVLQFVLNPMKI